VSTPIHFDYAIIGCGVAGLHLAYQLSQKDFFSSKRIILIDRTIESTNDKILSYWEKGEGYWDSIIYKSWNTTYFQAKDLDLKIDLAPYLYKSLKFQDFSNYCKKEISKHSNFTFLEAEIDSVIEKKEKVLIKCIPSEITATYIFDSRFSKNYNSSRYKYSSIIQSFKGWEVVFDSSVFDPNIFTMMDYRYQWKDSNSFMYILPKSNNQALLEYTFFAPFTISDENFDSQIKNYIAKIFPKTSYTIKKMESGEIPMTSYPFKRDDSKRICKIGTAGGWVKASTGYSFKFSEKNAQIIASQLEKGNKNRLGYQQAKRFKFYDNLFIRVLYSQNNKGPKIFNKMYCKIKPNILFRFLDEETTFLEEVRLILKLPFWPFIKSLFLK